MRLASVLPRTGHRRNANTTAIERRFRITCGAGPSNGDWCQCCYAVCKKIRWEGCFRGRKERRKNLLITTVVEPSRAEKFLAPQEIRLGRRPNPSRFHWAFESWDPSHFHRAFILQEVFQSLTEARSRRCGCKSEKSCIQREKEKAEGRIQTHDVVAYRPRREENRNLHHRASAPRSRRLVPILLHRPRRLWVAQKPRAVLVLKDYMEVGRKKETHDANWSAHDNITWLTRIIMLTIENLKVRQKEMSWVVKDMTYIKYPTVEYVE